MFTVYCVNYIGLFSLGAKPPKRKAINYKELKRERMIKQKADAETEKPAIPVNGKRSHKTRRIIKKKGAILKNSRKGGNSRNNKKPKRK